VSEKVQDKLVLLTARELHAVDEFIEELMAKRLRMASRVQSL
jgi:hypothetical protein